MKFIATILLLSLGTFSFGQIRKGVTHLDLRINGKVKSMTLKSHNPSKSQMKIAPTTESYIFNEKGHATYTASETRNSLIEVYYDTLGYAFKKVVDKKSQYNFINTYQLGVLMKVEYDSVKTEDQKLPFWMMGYSHNLKMAFETHYDDTWRLIYNYKYGYNEKGLVYSKILVCCDSNAEFYSHFIGEKYEYDNRHNMTKKTMYHHMPGKVETHYTQYNSRGRETRDSIIVKFGSSYKVKPKKRSHENQSRVKTTEYDDNLNPIRVTCQTEFDKTPLVIIYNYEYDDQKNWTKRSKIIGEATIEVTERSFVYYE